MITQEHEYYLRFILLLIQGGTEVLREIAAKALQKCNTHLNNFLSKNASAIQNTRDLSKKQKEILYPSSPTVVSSIKNYDITLLSYLITNFLTENLDGNEKNAVDKIKEMRNVYHAHTNEAKMTASIYTKEWNKLVRIIYTVSHNLPEEKRNSLNEIIDSIENEQLDIKVVIDEIRKLDQTNDFFEYIKKSIDDLNQNLDARFSRIEKDILEIKFRLENQGKKTKVVNTVRGQVTLSADEQETVDYAEKLLLEASKEIVEKSQKEHNKQLKQKVGDFLQDVEQLDIKVEKVSKGSIVFEFKCFSLSALLDLINFFNSSKFKARLHEIAAALEDITGKKINISGTLDIQSFHDVITKMQEKKYEKVVNFEMECTGVDGLLHAVEIFEGEKAANSLNELSTALSESVGKPVTLNTSIDIDQMQRAIDSIKEELDYPESDETSMNPSERDVGRQTECDTVMAMADTVANTVYDVSPHSKSVASLNLSSELKLKSYLTHKQDITTELNGKGTDRRIFPADMTSTILDNYSKHIANIDQAKLEEARELLMRHRMVAISGPAKSGKTSISVALAKSYMPDEVLFLHSPDDIRSVDFQTTLVVVIDDYGGKHRFDWMEVNRWLACFDLLHEAVTAGKLKVVVTCETKKLQNCIKKVGMHPLLSYQLQLTKNKMHIKQESLENSITSDISHGSSLSNHLPETSVDVNRDDVRLVQSVRKYRVSMGSDEKGTGIWGCCMLPDGEILLADVLSYRLKKLDSAYNVISECHLPDVPKGVSYIGNNVVVVNMYKQLVFVDVSSMTVRNTVTTDHKCESITCHNDKLYVMSSDTVYMYTLDGNNRSTLYQLQKDSYYYNDIAVGDDGNRIYIAAGNDRLITIDSFGNLLNILTLSGVGDGGVYVDDRGNVWVGSGYKLYQVSADGARLLGTVSVDEKFRPCALCYDRDRSSLIVTDGPNNNICVIRLD